jgi:protocatechuate 3,4-dioxygenase beta subunit
MTYSAHNPDSSGQDQGQGEETFETARPYTIRIEDNVTYGAPAEVRISATIQDPQGRPIPGATVNLNNTTLNF